MSAAPILARAKQRSSASSSSGSSQLAPSRSGHLSRKPQQHVPGRSMVGGRSQSQGYRTSNGVVGGRTSSRPPSATALVGNLATTYKQLQIDIKKLKDDHEIQKRAFKDAQRNANSTANDLSNANADGEDRKTRLEEVANMHASCSALSTRVEGGNARLEDALVNAKSDVECLQVITQHLNAAKQIVLEKLQRQLLALRDKNKLVKEKLRQGETDFKLKDQKLDSDIERKKNQLLQLKTLSAGHKDRANALGNELAEANTEARQRKGDITVATKSLEEAREEVKKLQVQIGKNEADAQDFFKKTEKEFVETRTSLGIIKIEHQHVFKCDAEISKSLDNQMDVVKGKQSKLNNDTAERSTFLSSLVKKIDNYQTLNSQHEETLNGVEIESKKQQDEMKHLEAAQGEHDQELLHVTKKTEDAIMNLNELKQECKQKETLIEEATQRSQEFEKEVSAKEVDLDKTVSDLGSQLKALNTENKNIVEDLTLKREEKKQLAERDSDLKAKQSALDASRKIDGDKAQQEEAKAQLQLEEAQAQVKTLSEAATARELETSQHREAIDKSNTRIAMLDAAELSTLSSVLRNEFLPANVLEEIEAEKGSAQQQSKTGGDGIELALDSDIAALNQQLEQMRSSHVEFRTRTEAKCAMEESAAATSVEGIQAAISSAQKRVDEVIAAEKLAQQAASEEEKLVADLEAEVLAAEQEEKEVQAELDAVVAATAKTRALKEKEREEIALQRQQQEAQEAEATKAIAVAAEEEAKRLAAETEKAAVEAAKAIAVAAEEEAKRLAAETEKAAVEAAATAAAFAASVAAAAVLAEENTKREEAEMQAKAAVNAQALAEASRQKTEKKEKADAAKKKKKAEAEKKKAQAQSAAEAALVAAEAAKCAAAAAAAAVEAEKEAAAAEGDEEEDEGDLVNSLFDDYQVENDGSVDSGADTDGDKKDNLEDFLTFDVVEAPHSPSSTAIIGGSHSNKGGKRTQPRPKSPPHVIGQGDDDEEEEEENDFSIDHHDRRHHKPPAPKLSSALGAEVQERGVKLKDKTKSKAKSKSSSKKREHEGQEAEARLAPLPALVPLDDKHQRTMKKSGKLSSLLSKANKSMADEEEEERGRSKEKRMKSGTGGATVSCSRSRSPSKKKKCSKVSAPRDEERQAKQLPVWKPLSSSSTTSKSDKNSSNKKMKKSSKSSSVDESDWLFNDGDFSFN